MEKSFVFVELKPYLHDYVYHEFNSPPDSDGVEISTTNDIGKMILSCINVAARPPKIELKNNPLKIYIPTLEWNHFLCENFLYIPDWKQRMIQEYIEASFRLKIREFFLNGYERGCTQKQITEAFCAVYNIRENAINFDAIKKYDYRNRRKLKTEVRQAIQLGLQFS